MLGDPANRPVHPGRVDRTHRVNRSLIPNPSQTRKNVVFVQEDVVLVEQAYIMFYAKSGTLWSSDYIQIHMLFVYLVIPTTSVVGESNDAVDETSRKPELNKIGDNDSIDKLIFYFYLFENLWYCLTNYTKLMAPPLAISQ
ncbi:hypothetical protein H5410_035839 [Solanum commersonii]|uniref:Uncharacterized protein n=1 Tax=Solanum commersonii TaxID=4109 RepID=A0A9J5Y3Z9_SOLCO|nr:hypothetical protein H5410_035839 [Solanum commersonii]